MSQVDHVQGGSRCPGCASTCIERPSRSAAPLPKSAPHPFSTARLKQSLLAGPTRAILCRESQLWASSSYVHLTCAIVQLSTSFSAHSESRPSNLPAASQTFQIPPTGQPSSFHVFVAGLLVGLKAPRPSCPLDCAIPRCNLFLLPPLGPHPTVLHPLRRNESSYPSPLDRPKLFAALEHFGETACSDVSSLPGPLNADLD